MGWCRSDIAKYFDNVTLYNHREESLKKKRGAGFKRKCGNPCKVRLRWIRQAADKRG